MLNQENRFPLSWDLQRANACKARYCTVLFVRSEELDIVYIALKLRWRGHGGGGEYLEEVGGGGGGVMFKGEPKRKNQLT